MGAARSSVRLRCFEALPRSDDDTVASEVRKRSEQQLAQVLGHVPNIILTRYREGASDADNAIAIPGRVGKPVVDEVAVGAVIRVRTPPRLQVFKRGLRSLSAR